LLWSFIAEVFIMATNLESNLESTIKESIHTRTDAAVRAAHDIVDRVAKRAEVSEEKLREQAGVAQQKLQESWQQARVKGVGAKTSVTSFVRRHPFASLGIAIGLGALLTRRGGSSVGEAMGSSGRRVTDKSVDRDVAPMH
jgi:ElaB/YqjD/DUF883 family membrane-anchored ribosome-binding protein